MSSSYFLNIGHNDPATAYIRRGGGGSMEVDWNEVSTNFSFVSFATTVI
jgi:hypothetical protein